MYNYTAGATGLDAAMPPWVQDGGLDEWCKRLADPAIRARVAEEMRTPTDAWENLLLSAGSRRATSATWSCSIRRGSPTFEQPHQLAVGVQHVFVNGVQVLDDGEPTAARPGRVVRGPGWTGWNAQR